MEGLDEVVRKLLYKTDGIGERDLARSGKFERARRRIECREQLVVSEDVGIGERVHQARFAGVRIAREGDAEHAR